VLAADRGSAVTGGKKGPFMRKPKLGKRSLIALSSVVMLSLGAGVTYAAGGFDNTPLGSHLVGRQPDGSYLTQTGQYVTPAGDVIPENGRPFGLALNPSGKTAASLNTGGGTTGVVSIFDVVNHKLLQQIGSGGISNGGLLYSPDGQHLWIAQTTDLLRFDVAPDGTLSNQVKVALPGANGRQAVPAGLAWAPNGNLLVTLSANNTLGVVDTTSNTVVNQIPVGNAPNSVVVIGGKAYVSNQGGRPAQPGDQTDNSYGTPIVTNNQSAVPSTGTVSEVDLTANQQSRTFPVGLEPSALLADGTNLIVANTDDDTVSTIDTVKQQVGRTFSANPAPGAPFGAQPNGLTMLDPTHLAVSLGRDNAVAVYQYQDATTQPSFEGLIPTGSFPTGIAQDPQLNRLVVASEQGLGSVGPNGTVNQGTGTNPATSHLGYNFVGTVQTIAPPAAGQMATYTQQVFKNNQWNGLQARNNPGTGKAAPVPVPVQPGDPSAIQHVFLIVKENRTYDQVLGDDPRGNGDPSLAQFGKQVTPNTHALADTFPLIDNLYSDGTNSAEGHHWLDQAFVNNYMQQMYGNYTRSYQTGDPMSDVKTGWIWDDALSHGKTVNNWGEQINNYVDSKGNGVPGGSWPQWYQDSQIMEGKASGSPHVPIGTYQPQTDIPSLAKVTQPDYPNFNLNIPDQYRTDLFQQEFGNFVKNNNLPALNMLWLPDDHTNGTSPGINTPRSYVADNDLALGRIVDTISHSPYWKNSAIFVVEDDSQNGVDHVDGHRNPTQVISPYAARGAVVHTNYSQVNIMRTIEQILGLPPMNQEDLTATPMSDAFTNKPDFTPYTFLPNQIPLTETNPQPTAATSAVQTSWATWSAKQNFASEDMVNMGQLNRDIWYSTSNFTVPYPGDSTVLTPDQVPGADPGPAAQPAPGQPPAPAPQPSQDDDDG
jgi:YVTN family beta-propeller protein